MKITGSAKNTITVSGIVYVGSKTASTTFCMAPTGHTQPLRQKPKYKIEKTLMKKIAVRDRFLSAKYVTSESAAANTPASM